MQSGHIALWGALRTFVARACDGRDATHGLIHMQTVAERAVMLWLCDYHSKSVTSDTFGALRGGDVLGSGELKKLSTIASHGYPACDASDHWRRVMLARVILVAMLHDVNDHKYDDAEGTLTKSVEVAIDDIISQYGELLADPREGGSFPPLSRDAVLATMSAISFSKENKKGMRYYVDDLGPSWTMVRDVVSDADKLEAIGESGLVRCWEFGLTSHCPPGRSGVVEAGILDTERQQRLLQRVKDHADEKLFLLTANFMSTPTGRFLGAGRDDDMRALLAKWSADSTLLPPM